MTTETEDIYKTLCRMIRQARTVGLSCHAYEAIDLELAARTIRELREKAGRFEAWAAVLLKDETWTEDWPDEVQVPGEELRRVGVKVREAYEVGMNPKEDQ